jgi:hypothetical protein
MKAYCVSTKKSTRARVFDNFAKLSHINLLTATGDMEIFPSMQLEITRWQLTILRSLMSHTLYRTGNLAKGLYDRYNFTAERKRKMRPQPSVRFPPTILNNDQDVSFPVALFVGFSAPGASHHNGHPKQNLRTLQGMIIYFLLFGPIF